MDPLHEKLQKHFGFAGFLAGQELAIRAILAGQDSLIVMPTGGGKSLCYQLPALILDGITVVVSPLIALMKDQVDALIARGIPATAINSTLSESAMDERISGMARGDYRLVYIAPERFRSERFVRALSPLSIALFALDEAHCISQWGHDFRPDYLRMKHALAELGQPPVAALTATATPDVRDDIVAQLELGKNGRTTPQVLVSGFARHNLTFSVTRVSGREDKLGRIEKAAREQKNGIVYCSTRKNVERVTSELAKLNLNPIMYHAGMPDSDRHTAQDRFISSPHPLIVATNAFGMGIDRPDIRFVIHYDIPGSVEAYYQEAGRAGRDGEAAFCDLLFNYADLRTQEFFLEGSNPPPDLIRSTLDFIRRSCANGPAELDAKIIGEQIEGKTNDMAISTAIALLEKSGVIKREYDPTRKAAIYQLISRGPDEAAIDFTALEEKRKRDEHRLAKMVRYADARGCRHRFILDYFGDTSEHPTCTMCDNCHGKSRSEARLPDDEEVVILQKTLSCVARMKGRYGRGRVTQVLTGSTAKQIIAAGLDKLSTYNLLADEGSDYVWSLLDALIEAGCIEVSKDEYRTISLAPLGDDVMRLKKSIPIHLPDRRQKKVSASSSRRAELPDDLSPFDERAFEALRAWRREKADEMGGVPAYLIFSDRTLRDLARTLPADAEALQKVRGIGPAKLARFGNETLAIIAASRTW